MFKMTKDNVIDHIEDNIIYIDTGYKPKKDFISLTIGRIKNFFMLDKTLEDKVEKPRIKVCMVSNPNDLSYLNSYDDNPCLTILNISKMNPIYRQEWYELLKTMMSGLGKIKPINSEVYALVPYGIVFDEECKINRLK